MQKIIVVSLGPGSRDQITLGALDCLKNARRVVLRTGQTDAARYLRDQGIAFETLDSLHEECPDFDVFIDRAAQAVCRAAARTRVVYAVLDALSDETAAELMRRHPDKVGFAGGTGLAMPLLQAAGARLPVRVVSASSLSVPQTQDALLVVEMNSRMLAGDCKLVLGPWYGEETEVLFFPPSEKEERSFVRIPLWQMDMQPRYDHTAALYIPALPLRERTRYDLWDLRRVMGILRGEGGCPWDRAQTHRSLSRYLIEEAYETSEAVAAEDWEHAADELGDVLLQVFFQADIGEKCGTFALDDITTAICSKMIARHRHIFGDARCDTPGEVAESWEKLKQQERGNDTPARILGDVSPDMPALLRAEKMLRKAEGLGMDASGLLSDSPAAELIRQVQLLREKGLCAEEELHLALANLVKKAEKHNKIPQNP